jgi:hypothetical protein
MLIFISLIVAMALIASVATWIEYRHTPDILDAIGHWFAIAFVALLAMSLAWALIFAITTVIGF